MICVSEPDPKYVWISELVAPIEVLDSWIINPSLGGLAISPPLFAGRTYLTLYVISFVFLLSPFLLIYDLEVESPRDAVPRPVITSECIRLSVDAVETLIYHWLPEVSYWTGWPISPEFLSDTLLTTFNDPPRLLIVNACAFLASFSVFASLISLVEFNPALLLLLVIAK